MRKIALIAIPVAVAAVVFGGFRAKSKHVSAHSGDQIGTQAFPYSGTIPQYRPVMTAGGTSVVLQTGTNPAYGISMWSGVNGDVKDLGKYGDLPCEFDGVPVSGNTAVALNGFCHDSGVVSDIAISNTVSAVGKIMDPRADLGPNFYMITFAYPGRRGGMISAASMDPATMPPYIVANQTPQVQSDWNAVSGLGVVLNKPALLSADLKATGTIGGSLLAVGACATVVIPVSGAVVGRGVTVAYTDGSLPGGSITPPWGSVTSTGNVTVQECAFVLSTPPSKTIAVYVKQY